MSFNSLTFLIFIAIFGALWPLVKKHRLVRYATITFFSLLFYGWWDWRFLFLLIFTGIVDFCTGLAMEKTKTPFWRRVILAISITSNLGVLFIFKYSGFVADAIDGFLGTHLKENIPAFTLILPVGISFYTFQSLSYTIDVYRKKLVPTRNPLHFFAFISLFPQLVAGPIIRATDLLWKLEKIPSTTESQRFSAAKLIALGYVQKIFIADSLAGYVDKAFANPQSYTGTALWWTAMVAFALQIYCDFAGYSNIARGLLKFMGYGIKPNFRFPYLAAGFRDFWSRWHISLSTWFRDYVYIPLGGSRGSKLHQYGALWVTFILSGLWHGANWTFLIWGALHAAYLTIERLTKWPTRIPHVVAIVATFMLAVIAWVFFRAANFQDAAHILNNMLTYQPTAQLIKDTPWIIFAWFILIEWYVLKRPLRVTAHRNPVLAHNLDILIPGIMLGIAIVFRGAGHGFIYFQF